VSPLALDAILACSVCFGDPSSELSQGAKAGVLLLLGTIGFVLAAIVFMIAFWAKRARMLEASEAYEQKPAMKIALQ
jgi:hypothetical protein